MILKVKILKIILATFPVCFSRAATWPHIFQCAFTQTGQLYFSKRFTYNFVVQKNIYRQNAKFIKIVHHKISLAYFKLSAYSSINLIHTDSDWFRKPLTWAFPRATRICVVSPSAVFEQLVSHKIYVSYGFSEFLRISADF